MSQTIVQTKRVASNAATFDSPVTAGNTILVFTQNPTAASTTCSDGTNSYSQVDAVAAGIVTFLNCYRAYNVAAGSTTVTVQNQIGIVLVIIEIAGAENASDPVEDFDHLSGNIGGSTVNSVLSVHGGLYAWWGNTALNDNTGFVSPLTQNGTTGSPSADASSVSNNAGTYPVGMNGGTGSNTNVFMCLALKDKVNTGNSAYYIRNN